MNHQALTEVNGAHQEAYARDGVVLVKHAFDSDWVALLNAGLNRIQRMRPEETYRLPEAFLREDPNLEAEMLANRSDDWERRRVYTEQAQGFVRYKYMRWWCAEFEKFVFDSPAAELIGRVIGSNTIRFFIDAMFMKEPNCSTKTYWHSDRSAWPVKGNHVPTMWMPLLPVSAQLSSLEYIAESHKSGAGDNSWPNTFNAKMLGKPDDRLEFFDWETRRGDASVRFLAFDMEPGDVVILHPAVHHGGGPNLHPTQPRIAYSTRWFGDDLVWDPKPECVNIPGMPLTKMTPGKAITEDNIFPLLWNAFDHR